MPLFPEEASRQAAQVDSLFWFMMAMSTAIVILVVTLIVGFAVRYRAREEGRQRPDRHEGYLLEITWTAAAVVVFLGMFLWGGGLYVVHSVQPENAETIYAVGKQWMWKFQHSSGPRELNQLHVPKGQPIKMVMISQDVIHSFFVPAFRVKQDLLPDRYTITSFTPTKTGRYHLLCAEYCGAKHAKMNGWVEVMEPQAYEAWLESREDAPSPRVAGERLFEEYGCAACHLDEKANRAPELRGLYGSQVLLKGGGTVTADDSYIRESIIRPEAKVVAGFSPIMPAYEGRLSETELIQLLAYIRDMSEEVKGAPHGK